MASQSIDDILQQFLKDNDIYTSDEGKVIEVLKTLGIQDEKSLPYLATIKEDDISNEKTGVPLLVARKIVVCAQKSMGDTRSESASTSFVPSDSTLEGQASVSYDPVEAYPQRNITVRYVLCQGLYSSSVNEKWIRGLNPQEDKLSSLRQLIIKESHVPTDMELELFSHEGYPLNANKYTIDFELSKWKIKHMDLLYVFMRPQLQPVKKNESTLKTQDPKSGGDGLQIVSQPFGRFYIRADLGPCTSGKEIIQKVSGYTGLPTSLIKLYTRGKNAESVEHLQSTDVMKSGDKLTMVTLRSDDIYDGQEYKSFGKCTYNPQCPQTDIGYAKFYSILYYLSRKWPEVNLEAIIAYIQREYHLPPLTYSLKLLLEEKVLKSFACWVALVEGLYQVFKATLDVYCDVPEDRVFEFSDFMWGTIIAQSKKVQRLDTEKTEWDKRSLLCPISLRRITEPVVLPHCEEVFDKLSVEEKIKDNEAIPGCSVVNLTTGNVRTSELFERLLMYTTFEGATDTFTWSQHDNYSVPVHYSVPLLTPPDCTWQEIAAAKSELNIVSLTALDKNESCLTFLKNGHMAVFNEFSKDAEVSRKFILYNPLYNPKERYDGAELKLTRKQISALDSTNKDIVKLEDFLHPKARAAAATASPQVSRPHFAPVPEKPPDEAIVVTLDTSSSMRKDIYSGYSRIRAAVEYFHAFIDRTNGYGFHHYIGITTFGSSVRTLAALTTANSTILQSKLEQEIKTEKNTKLFDAIMDAAHQVIEFTSSFPNCRRRIVCLTDGLDNESQTKPPQVVTFLKENKITMDTILLTYPGENVTQKAISLAAGGLCFRPESHVSAMKLFELETLLSMQSRKSATPNPWHPIIWRVLLLLGHFKPLNAQVVERAIVRCIAQKSIVITSLDMCLELIPSNGCPPSVLLDFLYWLGKLVMHDQKRALESNLTLGDLEPFKLLPYNSTDPYGANDVSTNFGEDLLGKSFTTTNRVIQQHMLIGPGVGATTSTGAKRLLREVIYYKRNPHPEVEIYPSEDSNFVWKILMKAPEHTPYEGGIFLLCAKFPSEYPMKPPEIRFLTPIYHCNINSTGRICHSILDRHYVPSLSMKNIIEYIYGLLMAPEPLDPLDSVLAEEYRVNRPLYESKAREKTKQFAQQSWEDMRKLCIGNTEDADAPDELVCPLTSKLFQDPVMTMYGHTYERKALQDHLAKNNNQDPISKKEVDPDALFPNKTVLDLVRKYQANMCKKFT